ncbi:MAG: LuxR C-terminal-related transcriptional regulator [Aeromicrobium sp.]
MSSRVTVAVVDDHAIVRESVALHLDRLNRPVAVVGHFDTISAFKAADIKADVVVLDLHLRDGSSVEQIPELVSSGIAVLLYTAEERPVPLREAVAAGISGLMLKGDPLATLLDGIESVAAGEFYVSGPLAHALISDSDLVADLSEQQRQVLQCINEGLDYRATARVMGISGNTVKEYLARIRDKYRDLGVKPGNAHHLTRLAKDEGHLR